MPSRIKLINPDQQTLEAVLAGKEQLAFHLQVSVPDNWTIFGAAPFEYALKHIKENPASRIWWGWLPIQLESNTLLGNGGYKGPPNQAGMVEIGYEIAEAYRKQGYATELARMLIEKAFAHEEVKLIQAHTLAEKNASVQVLKKCGFEFVEELEDEEDGTIWRWIKQREQP